MKVGRLLGVAAAATLLLAAFLIVRSRGRDDGNPGPNRAGAQGWSRGEDMPEGECAPNRSELEGILRANGIDPARIKTLSRKGGQDALAVELPPERCVSMWRTFRLASPRTGYYPLLMWSQERFGPDAQKTFAENPAQETLKAGLAMKAEEWFSSAANAPDGIKASDCRGEWPKQSETSRSEAIHLYMLDSEKELGPGLHTVPLVFLPVSHSWEVPAYLVLGGWNDCPDPEVQVCMFKYWHDKYGAEVMTDGGDFVEFYVPRPPEDRESAMKLADQQFLFCYDIVVQGTGTIEALASELLKSPTWFFWWD